MGDGRGVRLTVEIGPEVLEAASRLAEALDQAEREAGARRPGMAGLAVSAARVGGFVALANSPVGSLAREALQAWADREHWLVECEVLGASREDLERHEAACKAMALTSPVFTNGDVWRAGWRLARRRLAAGQAVIPAPGETDAWADGLFGESYLEGVATVRATMRSLGMEDTDSQFMYLVRLLPEWRKTAARVWAGQQVTET